MSIDINCDLGESYGRFTVGDDAAIMPYLSSCNVACGFHGGDPSTIQKTIELAISNGVQIGAHPSYPDLLGFGRNRMDIGYKQLKDLLVYQIAALKGMTESAGGKLVHVKPHGALYNTMSENLEVARCVIEAVTSISKDLYLVGPAGRPWIELLENDHILHVQEIFADRNYNDDLTLVSRSLPNALIELVSERVDHVNRMVINAHVLTTTGRENPIKGDTICIHGDHPMAVQTALRLKESLESHGVEIKSYA